MRRSKAIITLLAAILLATTAFAQDRTTGGIKGKVRAKGQGPVSGVSVTVRRHEREVASGVTDSKGEFLIKGLAPGIYGLMFRKEGLSVGTLEDIQVKAGKTSALPDRLILTENEAAIARLWSSVFNESGFSGSAFQTWRFPVWFRSLGWPISVTSFCFHRMRCCGSFESPTGTSLWTGEHYWKAPFRVF